MEEKTEKSKLRKINRGSVFGYDSGLGTGESDCMSFELFSELDRKGALKSEVYVCDMGWMRPLNGHGGESGSGSGSSSGSGPDYGFGSGSGSGSGSGGSGSGSGCSCCCGSGSGSGSGTCSCSSGSGCNYGSGSGSGSGSGACSCSCGFGSGSGSGSGNTDTGSGSDSGSGATLYPGDETGSGASIDPIELMDERKFVHGNYTNGLACCEKILLNYGIEYGDSDHVIKHSGGDSSRHCINCINRHLNTKRVIIIGVNCKTIAEPNSAGEDHFVVITGRGYDALKGKHYYTFMDSATDDPNKGCSNSNRLFFEHESFYRGETALSKFIFYELDHVRPNDDGNYVTTSLK